MIEQEFKEQLKQMLDEAIHQQGENALSSYDDIIDSDMRTSEGITRLNAMSNVDFIKTILEV